MKILGVHDGHLATACLLEDGRVAAMASEERFTGRKNQGGIPRRAIEWVLTSSGAAGTDVDAVAVAGLMPPIADTDFYSRSRHKYFSLFSKVLPRGALANPKIYRPYIEHHRKKRARFPELKRVLASHGISGDKIRQVEHHEAHAATAFYLSGDRAGDDPVLVITLDGSGDGLCGTVSIGRGHSLERLKSLPSYHSLGIVYSRVTQHLGMKPLDHEYKVMGLAPYAPESLKAQAYEVFARHLALSDDGLSFENRSGAWGNSYLGRLRRDLTLLRFDAVAAGLQQRFEDLVVPFIGRWIEKTGIRNIALAGGSFMNVKLNMLLAERPEIENLFIMPSGGDESIALGAALTATVDLCAAAGRTPVVSPLRDLYWGMDFSADEIERTLAEYRTKISYRSVSDIERETAELLSRGKIVGRMKGRMEWGARALGNRSILADPSRAETVRKINAAIKMRDFWMPFAPSILWERRRDYLEMKKDIPAPYMVLAFRSTPLAHKELIAGLHPFDLTCRPQLVQKEWNEPYHRLLKNFEDLTGIGGVLNTSFNIHGTPIVRTPKDAIETLLNSGLDYVTIGDFLVSRA